MQRLLECSNDEAVLRALGIPKRLIRHHPGSGEVANALKKAKEPCIAMVDEDPRGTVPLYLQREFREVERGDGLIFKESADRRHRLIVVMPDLEPWLLQISRDIGIPPEKFQLPSNPNQLHLIGDSQRLRFGKWIEAMHSEGATGLVRLLHWLGD
jgi:hypothetical protein